MPKNKPYGGKAKKKEPVKTIKKMAAKQQK